MIRACLIPPYYNIQCLMYAFLLLMLLQRFAQTKGASWKVPTGRRDGRVSLASETANLPAFFDSIEVQKQKFSDKGLSDKDLVALVGKNLRIKLIIIQLT